MVARKRTGSSGSANLRTKTKNSLSRHARRTPEMSPEACKHLISELETQNQELREKQIEIEEARRRYLDLYNFAPVGYFIFDQKGKIVDLNLTGARLLGLSKNQIVDTPFALFVAKEFVHRFRQHLDKVFSGNKKEACELKMRQRDQKAATYVSVESLIQSAGKSGTCWSAVTDITERKLAEQELMAARQELIERNVQLQRHSARLLETQEEERSRVAGDVHDSFASQLCAIKDQLQFLRGKGEDDKLKLVFDQLDMAIHDARRIQQTLRPPVLDDLGLFPALNMLCREFQESYPHIHVEKIFLLEKDNVPDSIEVPLYRITEEAFKNIITHSRANSVSISLNRKDSFIQLVIQDNGQGFDVEEKLTSGVARGLSTMRERAVSSGGLFDIQSMPGKGTTLRVSWLT